MYNSFPQINHIFLCFLFSEKKDKNEKKSKNLNIVRPGSKPKANIRNMLMAAGAKKTVKVKSAENFSLSPEVTLFLLLLSRAAHLMRIMDRTCQSGQRVANLIVVIVMP